MGVCISRCGEAQQKAGLVTVSISQPNCLQHTATSPHDPNHSLKKFLHLHASSSRRSLGQESLVIPHSSELFSLPDSDIGRCSSAMSPSSARTSRASISSRVTSSPKSRNSFSQRGGRLSTDRASGGCSKRSRTPRSSSALVGDYDYAAYLRLVEAIARLQRLSDGKNLQWRGSSVCGSDLERVSKPVLQKTRSRRLERPSFLNHQSRHTRYYQLPLQRTKFMMCSSDHNSLNKPGIDAATLMSPPGVSRSMTLSSPASLAELETKLMPLDYSATNLACKHHKIPSIVEKPLLSSSFRSRFKRKDEPSAETTISKRVEDSKCVRPRLSGNRSCDTDSDEMFTHFEATLNDSHVKRKLSPRPKSLQQMVQSTAHGCHSSYSKLSTAEKATSSQNLELVMKAKVGKYHFQDPLTVNLSAQKATDSNIESYTVEKAAKPILVEINSNGMSVLKKSPSKLTPLKRFRRGVSRSLDLREIAAAQGDFGLLRNGSARYSVNRFFSSSENKRDIQASSVEAESTELRISPEVNTCSVDGKLEQGDCGKQKDVIIALEPSSTFRITTPEPLTPQVFAVPCTDADCYSSDPGKICDDKTLELPEVNSFCAGTTPTESTCCSELESASISSTNSPPSERDPVEGGHNTRLDAAADSQRFLCKAFNSLLTLLQATIREQPPEQGGENMGLR